MEKGARKKFLNKKAFIAPIIIISLIILTTFSVIFSDPQPLLSPTNPECRDGLDNDGDGLIDFISTDNPNNDPECTRRTIDNECKESRTLFRISNESNAHARINVVSADLYPFSVCYLPPDTDNTDETCFCGETDIDTGDPIPCTIAQIVAETAPVNLVARLSSSENAHVEGVSGTNYIEPDLSNTACFGEFFTCEYINEEDLLEGEELCHAGFECLASVAPLDPANPDTNMQVGRCKGVDAYPTKICCLDTTGLGTAIASGAFAADTSTEFGRQAFEEETIVLSPKKEFFPPEFALPGSTWRWRVDRKRSIGTGIVFSLTLLEGPGPDVPSMSTKAPPNSK